MAKVELVDQIHQERDALAAELDHCKATRKPLVEDHQPNVTFTQPEPPKEAA